MTLARLLNAEQIVGELITGKEKAKPRALSKQTMNTRLLFCGTQLSQ